MNRTEKAEAVSALKDAFSGAPMVVLTHYSGLTVAEMTDLRNKMREAGATYKVAKNRLAKIAITETEYEGIADMLTGPTGIAFSADAVSAAKVVVDYAKNNEKLVVTGGAIGSQVLDAEGVKALSKLPSLDELRSKLVGLISAPAQRMATVTQAPASQLARVLMAYSEKGEQDAA